MVYCKDCKNYAPDGIGNYCKAFTFVDWVSGETRPDLCVLHNKEGICPKFQDITTPKVEKPICPCWSEVEGDDDYSHEYCELFKKDCSCSGDLYNCDFGEKGRLNKEEVDEPKSEEQNND